MVQALINDFSGADADGNGRLSFVEAGLVAPDIGGRVQHDRYGRRRVPDASGVEPRSVAARAKGRRG